MPPKRQGGHGPGMDVPCPSGKAGGAGGPPATQGALGASGVLDLPHFVVSNPFFFVLSISCL